VPYLFSIIVGVLSLLMVGQLALISWGFYQKTKVDQKVKELEGRLGELEAKKLELFGKAADVMAVTGSLQARNEWFQSREKSPVKALVKIERSSSPGVILDSFSGSQNGGNLQFEVSDAEAGQAWVKSCFGSYENQMNLEKNSEGGIVIHFSWNE